MSEGAREAPGIEVLASSARLWDNLRGEVKKAAEEATIAERQFLKAQEKHERARSALAEAEEQVRRYAKQL